MGVYLPGPGGVYLPGPGGGVCSGGVPDWSLEGRVTMVRYSPPVNRILDTRL